MSILTEAHEDEVREHRKNLGIVPVYKRVDTCGAEFESFTPYLYSTYEEECEAEPTETTKDNDPRFGPNRIGQGIEFDYCCCHASFALRDADFETIMVNCNPETVSTDYDTSDRLYFEPLTFEDVMNIVECRKTGWRDRAVRRTDALESGDCRSRQRCPIIGTSPDSIDLAEDRKRFGTLLEELDIPQARAGWPRRSKKPSRAQANRLSGAGASTLCARRPRNGDRLRRRDVGRYMRRRLSTRLIDRC